MNYIKLYNYVDSYAFNSNGCVSYVRTVVVNACVCVCAAPRVFVMLPCQAIGCISCSNKLLCSSTALDARPVAQTNVALHNLNSVLN